MEQLLAAIFAELVAQWQWDIDVMSQPWMYWALLIPICVYVPFFFMKWAVLTTPLWLPVYLLVAAIRSGWRK